MHDATFEIQTRSYFGELLDHLFQYGGDFSQCATEARKAAQAASISEDDFQDVVLNKWRDFVDLALADHLLSEEEEERLKGIMNAFDLPSNKLDQRGCMTKLVKAAVLRDLQKGTPKTRVSLDIPLPFKLQKREVVLWAFPKTRLIERITKRKITGGSTGASFRVMKGVYWRVGAFKGVPVSWDETHHTDTGLLVLTNKHLLFSGPVRNQRIAYSRLASIDPYSDAIEVQRDAATAKPQIFRDIDGQFAYNIIQFS